MTYDTERHVSKTGYAEKQAMLLQPPAASEYPPEVDTTPNTPEQNISEVQAGQMRYLGGLASVTS